MHQAIAGFLPDLLQGRALTRQEAALCVPLLQEHRLDIYALARLAASAQGPDFFTCGIINAKSGRCAEDCAFCAQSQYHATEAPVYGLLSPDAIIQRARDLSARGARYMGIVLSGASPTKRDLAVLCETAQRIRASVPIKLCASLGLVTANQAADLKNAGFTSYHHNLETARSWFGRVCATHSYEARVETARNAKAAGLRLCCGGIFGLGEGWDERLELAETLAELGVDSIPINFLNPIKGTPLESALALSPQEALDSIALLRLMNPAKDLLVCGGRPVALGSWDKAIFFAGASGLMIGDYLTTQGKHMDRDKEMLAVLGLSPR